MAERGEVAEVLNTIKEQYPQFEVRTSTLNLWARHLQFAPVEALRRAVDDWFCESRFQPTMSDIRKTALKLCGGSFRKDSLRKDESGMKTMHQLADMVKVGHQHWVKKQYAVRVNGTWVQKIDFCMGRLGAAKVSEILRQELGYFSPGSIASDLVAGKFPVAKYKILLNELVGLAESTDAGVTV